MNIIDNTTITNNRFEVKITDQLHEYINEDFFYVVEDTNIENIPKEILLIPFIVNIAPIVWLSGMTFSIREMDNNLYHSLNSLKQHLCSLYPDIRFNGEIVVEETINIKYDLQKSKFIQLFSGGVDSVFTLLQNKDSELSLLTVRGSDTALNDNVGWGNIKNMAKKYTTNKQNLKNYFIESNFKVFLNTKKIKKEFKRDWWTATQFGVGTSSFMSILSFLEGSSIGYLGSSGFPKNKEGFSQYGEVPDIDNDALNWGKFRTEYHGVNFSRHDKVEYIHSTMINTYNRILPLRVFYSTDGAKNCSVCSKCYMTMVALLVSGDDYINYGFNISHTEFIRKIKSDFKNLKYELISPVSLDFRLDTQKRIKDRNNYKELNFSNEMIDFLMWYKEFDLPRYYTKFKKKEAKKRFFRNIEKKITSIFKGY